MNRSVFIDRRLSAHLQPHRNYLPTYLPTSIHTHRVTHVTIAHVPGRNDGGVVHLQHDFLRHEQRAHRQALFWFIRWRWGDGLQSEEEGLVRRELWK